MIQDALPNIPRIYTALAEWLACIVYSIVVTQRGRSDLRRCLWAVGGFMALVVLHLLVDSWPIQLWTLGIVIAVITMGLLIWAMTHARLGMVLYLTVRAFVLAELAASLAWQIRTYSLGERPTSRGGEIALILAIYGLTMVAAWFMERRHFSPEDAHAAIWPRQLVTAVAIGVLTFAMSNLSFLNIATPFSGRLGREVFYIRTLVDLCGVVVLYAQQQQRHEAEATRELLAMNALLRNQHDQYLLSKRTIEEVNRTYHDLRHQIGAIRAEQNPQTRTEYLDELEANIQDYGSIHRTGNEVMDVLLTTKAQECSQKQIEFTCVVDGTVLNGMSTIDMATLFGNALDNAIEATSRVEDSRRRIVKVAVYAHINFVVVRVENTFTGRRDVSNLRTTKHDTGLHGYGVKSIRRIADRYDGQTSIDASNGWFTLRVLLNQKTLAEAAR